jgi:putative transposase
LGVLDRLVLEDEQWDRISGLVIGCPDQRGSTAATIACLWRALDCPHWSPVFRRFSRWSQKGVWQRIFDAMSGDPDFEYLIIDSTIVRAHQHACGAKGGLKIRPLDARMAA